MSLGCSVVILAFFCCFHVQSRTIYEPAIIGGEEVYYGQYPWQVLLKKEHYGDVLCGGSIINPKWVLTAAHCTHKLINGVFVIYGTVNKDDHSFSQTVPQKNIIVHRKFEPDVLRNDVSLIKLETPIVFSDFISPIKLNFDDNRVLLKKLAVVIGFGVMSDENLEFSEHLMKTTMNVVENSICENVYNTDKLTYVTEATICAKPPPGKNNNICSGDSGGPLFIDDQGKWLQIGINSFVAKEACTEGNPSGFVRISKFKDFIIENTNIT
ncbi:hypothetical protein ACFFRR_004846 [Megaselia abdita]